MLEFEIINLEDNEDIIARAEDVKPVVAGAGTWGCICGCACGNAEK